MIRDLLHRLAVERSLLAVYLVFYFLWGLAMNQVGILLGIARFTYHWQIVTCYLLYMVPVSLLIRHMSFFEQYVYGVAAIAPVEFGGYALGTSISLGILEVGPVVVNHGNILAEVFNIKNFSLAMVIFFGVYFPLGNRIAAWLHRRVFPGAT